MEIPTGPSGAAMPLIRPPNDAPEFEHVGKEVTVGVCLIAGDMMHTETALSLSSAVNFASEGCGYRIMVNHHRGSVLAEARQTCIKKAIECGADWIFSVDSDMRFPRDIIPRMIEWGEPVVAANCAKRMRPIGPTARRRNAAFHADRRSEPVWPDPNVHGLEQVETVGFGAIMIRADVFKQLEWPWFQQPWHDDAQWHTGEDIFFCARCAEAGIPIYVDHGLSWQIQHLGTWGYSLHDVLAERQLAEAGQWDGNDGL